VNIEDLFQRWKDTLNRRYGEGFPADFVDKAHENLKVAFASFVDSKCADAHFQVELRSVNPNKSAQRLGEMLLYERLTHAGYHPEPSLAGRGPDFLLHQDGRRICLEVITPSIGDDVDITNLFKSHDPLNPSAEAATELRQRTLLRMTAAVGEKLKKYEGYLTDNVVTPEDILVIVVNDALLCPDSFFYGVSHNADTGVGGQSLAEHAVHGFGHSIWEPTADGANHVLKSTFRDLVDNRPEPRRDGSGRGPVPVNLFGSPVDAMAAGFARRASIISAVLQVTLREDYGVLMSLREKAETEERLIEGLLNPGILVPNPRANKSLDLHSQRRLMKVVDAPALTAKELWGLTNRHLKMLLGESYAEQPFPGLY
jgi:hypothetical protein